MHCSMEIQLCVFCQCYMEMTNVSGVNLLISSFQYILQKYKNKYFTSFLCFHFHMVIFTFISCTFIILASSQLLRSQSFWCLIVLICLEPWAKSYWHSSCPNLSLKIPCRLVLAFFFLYQYLPSLKNDRKIKLQFSHHPEGCWKRFRSKVLKPNHKMQ